MRAMKIAVSTVRCHWSCARDLLHIPRAVTIVIVFGDGSRCESPITPGEIDNLHQSPLSREWWGAERVLDAMWRETTTGREVMKWAPVSAVDRPLETNFHSTPAPPCEEALGFFSRIAGDRS
jgi:hypothetical protein